MTRKRKMSEPIMPPPVAEEGEDLRALFARTALGNPKLMDGVKTPKEAATRALRIADEMICALKGKEPPAVETPTQEDMKRWEESLVKHAERQERSRRDTVPAVPKKSSSQVARVTPRREGRRTPQQRFDRDAKMTTAPGFYRHIHLYDRGK